MTMENGNKIQCDDDKIIFLYANEVCICGDGNESCWLKDAPSTKED